MQQLNTGDIVQWTTSFAGVKIGQKGVVAAFNGDKVVIKPRPEDRTRAVRDAVIIDAKRLTVLARARE